MTFEGCAGSNGVPAAAKSKPDAKLNRTGFPGTVHVRLFQLTDTAMIALPRLVVAAPHAGATEAEGERVLVVVPAAAHR
jgi:hypothetical protein